jgi:hypothetical protein
MRKWIPAVSVLLLLAAGGLGVYLLIPAEPEYCWLVFGPEAKIRILLRLQGNKAYIDRDGKGEFIGREKTVFDGQQYFGVDDLRIADPDNQATYTITQISRSDAPHPRGVSVSVRVQGPVEYGEYCGVEMTPSPENAKEAHFHGPLTVELTPKAPWTLQRGGKPTQLRVNIGTTDEQKGCWVVVTTEPSKGQSAFPKGVHPVVDVEFPAKDQGPAIKRRYPLDEPC